MTKNVDKRRRDPAHRILTREQKRKCVANNAFEFEYFDYPTHLSGE